MLVKLTTGVNFTNFIHVAFTCKDSKSPKNTVKSRSFLRFRDFWGIKAVRKHVDKIDPWLLPHIYACIFHISLCFQRAYLDATNNGNCIQMWQLCLINRVM